MNVALPPLLLARSLHTSDVARHECLEGVQIVAVDNQVVVKGRLLVLRRERFGGIHLQRPGRNGQVMGVDEMFAFEVQGRHQSGSAFLRRSAQRRPLFLY